MFTTFYRNVLVQLVRPVLKLSSRPEYVSISWFSIMCFISLFTSNAAVATAFDSCIGLFFVELKSFSSSVLSYLL